MMSVNVLGLGVKMKNSKSSLTSYVLLVVCIDAAVAQFIGQQSQFPPNAERGTQLSPQQQGQILSDIQQHHRFNVPQSQQTFQPQHFARQQIFNQGASQTFQNNPQFINQPQDSFAQDESPLSLPLQYNQQQNHATQQTDVLSQQFLNQNREQFAQNQFLSTLPLVNSLPQTPQSSQLNVYNQQQPLLTTNQQVQPKVETTKNANHGIIQHHTQTNFQPNFASQSRSGQILNPSHTFGSQQQFSKPRPTIDPIVAIEEQIKELDPEKHKQKIRELREKQAIIEKHNQFVERQYEKALKKAQQDHEEFIEQQKEQKKKLYQKVHRQPGTENLHYSHTSVPRYIYPEEVGLFEQAVKQYYQEHPTTTTTTTTTTPPPTTTIKSTKKDKTTSFLPTALPAASNKVKTIQSIEDLDQLQKQYKSQRIRKDDLLEQLRLAIGKNTEDEEKKNVSSREISLANGKTIKLIEATDPKDIPNGKEEEIILPNGQKVTVIRADNPSIPATKPEEISLPDGQTLQVIRTTDPKAVPGGDADAPQEITLPNGQKAQLVKTSNPKSITAAASAPKPIYKAEEITLPNGEKVEVIKTTDPSLVPGGVKIEPGSELEKLVLSRTTTTTTTTIKPPKEILEELTKGVPASNFELLKTGASGGFESIGKNLPNEKKVTFVLLEEQSDGTLKVQGIKGNGKDKPEVDIDSILKKLKDGQIKLPAAPKSTTTTTTTTSTTTTKRPEVSTAYRPLSSVTFSPNSYLSEDELESKFSFVPTTSSVYTKASTLDTSAFTSEDSINVPILKTSFGTHTRTLPTSSSLYTRDYFTTKSTTSPPISTYKNEYNKPTRRPYILNYSQNDLIRQASTVSSLNQNSLSSNNFNSASTHLPKPSSTSFPSSVSIYQNVSPTLPTPSHRQNINPTQQTFSQQKTRVSVELPEILKKNGLYAMAKFLRQSGLDTILNETGPYTVFVPTDKAFRTLLVQLGGPEKAEEKFKENPRLLSGLLLHHVIPGAFTIGSLQDEMTGVSLAGTQLRVNQYNMHDLEWNDVTTINGAKVLEDKKDIEIPQGTAHAVDRVMFPLPVGDIVQTLQSDRERRFTSFLRAIFASGLAETLQGSKTFTLFAPTDKAFAGLSTEDLSRTVTDKILARELVLRHLLPGTLYTNGMRYYQIKDSLLQDRQLTFSKQSGKVKVNNVQIATQNIPTTNGVIHAIDAVL
ncbi:uncharacterized protein LOC108914546 isoform X2 [Anoplophora glabripennis]|uniref:uncharacterized protein LOC108914546 isoform X2 n=1 Tax=Anoplophora glabripennis TaxID=217634 RepID=UPI00087471B2|nr:uncharacterized protein LOC108914546 isoform X2 [Anoplophora glabripennis]